MLRRGRTLFADDQLTLDSTADTVRAHPGSPHMNLARRLPLDIDPQALGRTLGALAGERWLVAHRSTTRPRPVRLLCLLERGAGMPLGMHTMPASPLRLSPHMLGLPSDVRRQRKRFGLYADLVQGTPLVRLSAGLEHRPEQLGDMLEGALEHQTELAAGRIA
jgi:hypothetical protein